ncbi:unnamed protein product [Anisakis simplex]|uniref:Beta-galactosidase n=1 Tax=Anisakis simplex TaxID=6269 RepID=A0A0M3K2B2_ANISI|nr:unnamed protein product [Anisakis simplex]
MTTINSVPLILFVLICTQLKIITSSKSFAIDYKNNQFLLDGKPFQYISGSIHYHRLHPSQWNDRLARVRAAGLNAIQFYIPWNYHETFEGKIDFSGSRNVTRFLELAMQNELYALVRPGPYSCGEIDAGGLPWWLLKYEDIVMRTADSRFLEAVKRWWDVLLPVLKPYLRKNGGPILMLQMENEYGSYAAGCDRDYTIFLRDLARQHLGDDVVLYTTDGGDESYLKCGKIPGVYATIDCGPTSPEGFNHSFTAQRHFEPSGPLVNSEYYPGWFSWWGEKASGDQPIENVLNGSVYMFEKGASFNYYMFQGGTNFAFWAGGELEDSITTSYDFWAPLSEAGDITEKYLAIRNWIKTIPHWPNPPKDIPKNNSKSAYGKVQMKKVDSLVSHEMLAVMSKKCPLIKSKYPMSFEELQHPFGFVVYKTKLPVAGGNLSVPGLKDYGYGYLFNNFEKCSKTWMVIKADAGDYLSIIVENRGRLIINNYGLPTANDPKAYMVGKLIDKKMCGILSNVTLNGVVIENWHHYRVPLPNVQDETFDIFESLLNSRQSKFDIDPLQWIFHPYWLSQLNFQLQKQRTLSGDPGVYVGHFMAETRQDTFLDPTGWGKGQVLVNGFNIGRYWPGVGPQITLYVPSSIIGEVNTVTLLELTGAPACKQAVCSIELIDHPIANYSVSSLTHHSGRHGMHKIRKLKKNSTRL